MARRLGFRSLALALALCMSASVARAANGPFRAGAFQWGQGYSQALGACPRIPRPGMRHDRAASADAGKVTRFFHGVLWNRPDYDDMSATLARAVQGGLSQLDFPYLHRLAGDPTSVTFLGQRHSAAIYAVQMAGGKARGLASVDAQGKVDAAYLCEGGL